MAARIEPLDDATTLGELREFVERQRAALLEAGEVVFAENSHIIVRRDGRVSLSVAPLVEYDDPANLANAARVKALSIDPVFAMQESEA